MVKKILSFLLNSKWLLFYVFLQTAILFIFMQDAANHDTYHRVCVNICYFFIVAISLSLLRGGWRKLAIILLFIQCLIPNIIVFGWYLMAHEIMKSTDFWVVFDSNISEASGFASMLTITMILYVGFYLSLSVFSLVKAYKEYSNNLHVHNFIVILFIFFWLVSSLVIPFRSQVPAVDFYKSFFNYKKEQRELISFYENRKKLKIESNCYFQSEEPKTFVIVIGESVNRNHLGLYGYERNTTPCLDSMKKELFVYSNVVSPAIQTLLSLKQVLTFANYENMNLFKQEASIVEILNGAGYKTFWYDNQASESGQACGIDKYVPTSYLNIARQCDVCSFSGQYEEILLMRLDDALSDSSLNKVIFLHLMGSHFPYLIRYPIEYNKFTDDKIPSRFSNELSLDEKIVANAYDNSILYNDYVISKIINRLRSENGLSAMLYFSDHGEEVFDSLHYSGRSFGEITSGMYEIPFILWCNEKYKSTISLSINTFRPYCTDDVIHSIQDLVGVNYRMKDSSRSIFNSSFNPKKRQVQGRLID